MCSEGGDKFVGLNGVYDIFNCMDGCHKTVGIQQCSFPIGSKMASAITLVFTYRIAKPHRQSIHVYYNLVHARAQVPR